MQILRVEKLKMVDKYRQALVNLVVEVNYTVGFSMNKFMKENSLSRNFSTAIQKMGYFTYNNQDNDWYANVATREVDSQLTVKVLQEMYAQKGQVF